MLYKNLAAVSLFFAGFSAPIWASVSQGPICPMVYQPTTCTQDDISSHGSNSCFAKSSLKNALASEGLQIDYKRVRCVSSELQSADVIAPKVSKQICGIISTITTCSVDVEGKSFSQSATSCDSPVNGLRAQLVEAGVDLSEGLTALCIRSQRAEDTEFSVDL
ncbi:MAG: hypothetical protein EOP04_03330 [Proteobacteria bacterium]|nr:MAG: hypothetical protein EOP04_03330 [Pseudomonadota bacterium]